MSLESLILICLSRFKEYIFYELIKGQRSRMSGERKNFHFIMHMLKFWCELGAGGGISSTIKFKQGIKKTSGIKIEQHL